MEATEQKMASDQGSDAAESVSREGDNVHFKGNELFGYKEERRERGSQFPLRPLEPDCVFYNRTGYCRYGPLCMFNHPTPKKMFVQVKMRNNSSWSDQAAEENSDRVRKMECRFYMLPGGCRYGHACKFAHFPDKNNLGQSIPSSISFPVQPEEQECLQYMRTGRCRFAPNCKYRHHPLLTSVASDDSLSEYRPGGDDLSGYENGGSGTTTSRALLLAETFGRLQVSNQSEYFSDASSSWTPLVLPHQIYYSNGYQDPAASISSASKQNVRHTSVISGAMADPDINRRVNTEEHPESRIQSTHPTRYPADPTTAAVSPTGLPLRPDQPVCMYYSRYGLCKYGIGCEYDHPVGCGTTTLQSSNQFPNSNCR